MACASAAGIRPSRSAEAKLTAIGEQIQELTLLQCRLRRLVTVCEHGDSSDCVALRVGEARPDAGAERSGNHQGRSGTVGTAKSVTDESFEADVLTGLGR